jgi:asparagine synthase (glutamine-hydrolysing)
VCGILGQVGASDRSRNFQRALDRLAHRGPDGGCVVEFRSGIPVLLGHRRLAIVDLSDGGRQPMQRGHLTIVFNGEVFNHLELRRELEATGETFISSSDTEVLLAAYEVWGASCLHRLNGMWAFAIWNEQNQTLFLARDRFGEKPLFYSFQPGRFLFGSEMKALTPLMDQVRPSDSFQRCADNQFGYESTADCLIEDIHRLPAGCSALLTPADVTNRTLAVCRYWNTIDQLIDVPQTYEDQVDQFRELFFDACRIRMRADVPIGTALSGGLDSASVACAMHAVAGTDSAVAPRWQSAFVATFPGSVLDERHFAEAVIDKTGIVGNYLPVDPVGGLERLERYLYLFEEIYISNPVPFMDIYRLVSDGGVKVTLDGHGGDELLSGYGGFLQAMNDAFPNLGYLQHIMTCFTGQTPDFRRVLQQLAELHHGGRGLLKFLISTLFSRTAENLQSGRMGYLNRELYRCFHDSILPTLLRNYDRYSMASGVEIRMPFLDYRIVKFCFSLPWQSKVPRSSNYTKAILRDAMGSLLPDKIRFRSSKVGFTSPIIDWMRGPWRQFLFDHIASQAFRTCSLIQDPESLTIRLSALLDNVADVPQHRAESIWGELTPYFWEQFFLKNAA